MLLRHLLLTCHEDIKAVKHKELLSGMTNDNRMVVMDTLFVMCDSIEADNSPNDSIVQSVDIQDKPSSYVGLEDVLENGPWMIHNSPIILKKSTMNSCLCKEELTQSLNMVVPLINVSGFTIETVSIEYEWKPPCCDLCKIFGHVLDHCPQKVSVPSTVVTLIIVTLIVVTPNVEKTHDGFQTVGKRTRRVNLSPLIVNKPPKVTVPSSKEDNIPMSNSYTVLDEESVEDVENVYDELSNLLHSS
uniref:Zinc knuckle CX2CX4HX4C n=1 Tax=Tanacetum cinerariifolium TaxID=118510 RepID=A0A6L2L5A6_TANCI|nr:hypothetical protein [Tanacetum cinerariifolium]